jgi:ABC-type amino acid transport substrate-binding protein
VVRPAKSFCRKYCTSLTSLATYAAPVLIVIAWLITVLVEPPPVVLVTQHYPPYQIIDWNTNTVDGETVEVAKCTLDKLDIHYHIKPFKSWGEAQETVRNGNADGIVGALHTIERDMYAVWTAPAGFHFMHYISLEGNRKDHRDQKSTFAVKAAAGTAAQMMNAQKSVSFVGANNQEIIQALVDGKADFIYMDYKVFEYEANEMGIVNINQVFNFYPGSMQGYGLYFSNKYLKLHPGFLEKFNETLVTCVNPL